MSPAPRSTERLQPDEPGLDRAAQILREGGLVAFPTETVYGLGADATRDAAVAGIYAAKDRPRFNPLIAHLPSLEAALEEGVFSAMAKILARRFWPGPLTLVVPAGPRCTVCDLACAGLDSVALRVPGHPLALSLLARVGRPVAAPSANRSGRISPTSADHVWAELTGRMDAVLDGGPALVGVESTIVSCLDGEPRLLRPGGVPRREIEALTGLALAGVEEAGSAPRAPGMLASHYAPRAKVRLEVQTLRSGEAALLFGGFVPGGIEGAARALNLSHSGDLGEAASNLFSYLRVLDASGASTIAVVPIPNEGLGEAINDRLRRAAAARAPT